MSGGTFFKQIKVVQLIDLFIFIYIFLLPDLITIIDCDVDELAGAHEQSTINLLGFFSFYIGALIKTFTNHVF